MRDSRYAKHGMQGKGAPRGKNSEGGKGNYSLFAGESGPDHDEELFVRGCHVVWSAGGKVIKSYTLQSTVLQACWCYFADYLNTAKARSLCILQRETITVYAPDGGIYSVALPCKVVRIWPLLEGILLERATAPSEMLPTPEAPTLFSLMHPLEELKPLSMFVNSPSADDPLDIDPALEAINAAPDRGGCDFVCDPADKVVFASDGQPFILIYNQRDRVHTLWVLRQARKEVAKRMRSGLLDDTSASHRFSLGGGGGALPAQLGGGVVGWGKRLPAIHVSPTASPAQQHLVYTAEKNTRETTSMEVDGQEAGEEDSASDDENITAEIFVERVWRDEFAVPPASTVFFSSDSEKTLLFCLFSASTCRLEVLALRDEGGQVQLRPYAELRARAAMPIKSAWHTGSEELLSFTASSSSSSSAAAASLPTPSGTTSSLSVSPDVSGRKTQAQDPFNTDILLLDMSGRLAIYTGRSKMCELVLPLLGPTHAPPSSPNDAPMPASVMMTPNAAAGLGASNTASPSPSSAFSSAPFGRGLGLVAFSPISPQTPKTFNISSPQGTHRWPPPAPCDLPVVSTPFRFVCLFFL